MNILQAQMNKYIILTLIIPWPNITKTAELRQKNRKRRLFIAPQKIWLQPQQRSASKINQQRLMIVFEMRRGWPTFQSPVIAQFEAVQGR